MAVSARSMEIAAAHRSWGSQASAGAGCWLALLSLAALFIAVPTAVIGGLVGLSAAIALAVLLALFLAVWIASQGRLALRSIEAGPAESESERLSHMVREVARELSVKEPHVRIAPSEQCNALVCRAGGPMLAVTTGLIREYTRTELEAVVVHSLGRLRGKALTRAHIASAFGALGRRFAPIVGDADDIAAASLTRYPPALAAAIRKASPGEARWAAFWFVASVPPHRPVADRIALLADL